MSLVLDVIIIVLLFAFYGYVHSLLASIKIKIWFQENFWRSDCVLSLAI